MALTVLDAGVVIGVLDADDPHHQPSLQAVQRGLDAGARLVIPASVYAEILVGPVRRGEDVVARAEAFLVDVGAHIEPVTAASAKAAARLRASHPSLRLPDALVIATALTLNADLVVTTDARWPHRLPVKIQVLKPPPPRRI